MKTDTAPCPLGERREHSTKETGRAFEGGWAAMWGKRAWEVGTAFASDLSSQSLEKPGEGDR